MDDFTRYERLRDEGADPRAIASAGEADGLDRITLVRMIRKVCGLSLPEAKRVLGSSDPFETPQEVEVGSTVYWEVGDPGEGSYLVEGRVSGLDGEWAWVRDLKKFRVTEEGIAESPESDPEPRRIPRNRLQRSLIARLEDAIRLWDGLGEIKSQGVARP